MTTWGFIGSGNIGSTVARLAIAAGHDVVLSNAEGPRPCRNSSTNSALTPGPATPRKPRGRRRGGGDDSAQRPRLPVDALAGKIVIDTMNYYPDRDGHVAASTRRRRPHEMVQPHLPQSHVVKGFNSIVFRRLATSPARPAPTIAAPCPSPATTRPPRNGPPGARRPRLRHGRPRHARRRVAQRARPARHTAPCMPSTRRTGRPGRALPGRTRWPVWRCGPRVRSERRTPDRAAGPGWDRP